MTIWFTADTHFGHANIISFCDRPYETVQEMNWMIAKNFNELIQPDDTLYHLGDVAMGNLRSSLPVMQTINGHKILVPGNHDRVFSQNTVAYRERFRDEYLQGFDEIADEYVVFDDTFALCHFPFDGDSHDGNRFDKLRPEDDGRYLLHGHVHSKWKVNGRQINVGVDVWDYKPVSLQELLTLT